MVRQETLPLETGKDGRQSLPERYILYLIYCLYLKAIIHL